MSINPITPDTSIGSSLYVDEVGGYSRAVPTPSSKDTMAPAPNNNSDAIRAQAEKALREKIEAEQAAVRQKREALEKQVSDLDTQFAGLPWYEQAALFLVYEGYKIGLKIQIAGLSLIEKMSPEEVLASMKGEIDKFVADFEKASSGNPDREAPNPLGPKGGPDMITPGFPVIDAKGGGSVSPDGPNLITTLLDGFGLYNRLKQILFGSIFK